jgi:hypothetical protein
VAAWKPSTPCRALTCGQNRVTKPVTGEASSAAAYLYKARRTGGFWRLTLTASQQQQQQILSSFVRSSFGAALLEGAVRR